MKLTLQTSEKTLPAGLQAVIVPAEKEKLLGSLPPEHASWQGQVRGILKKQSEKVLNDGMELLAAPERLLVVFQIPQKKGLGPEECLRLAAGKIIDVAKGRSLARIGIAFDQAGQAEFRAFCEGLLLSAYEFRKYKSDKKPDKPAELEAVLLVGAGALKSCRTILAEVETVCRQINQCRDLVNEPGSVLNPPAFADHVVRAGREAGLLVTVRDEKKLTDEGFQGLWTVGKGSDHPPRLVTVAYDGTRGAKSAKGKAVKAPHLCMVGKGITFDTGGISIKPSAGMWEMKCDMAGAATVFSALCAIAALKLPIKASAVLCLAENRPGNAAVLPGDIFTAKNGKTVMVDNTDAEGRLVLTDGLAEAGLLGATHIIDLATLTGAVIRALGPAVAGLFSNDAGFAQTILASGGQVGEKFCQLPLEDEYREYLDDPTADMKNVGKSEGGAITAALFLQEFVPAKTAWSHWDIAGTAFVTGQWKYFKPGGTGWGVKTLVEVARKLSAG